LITNLEVNCESIFFEINPNDPCMANRMINGSQRTVVWHLDDLKSGHESSQINNIFNNNLNENGIMKTVRGKEHKNLAMTLDYSEKRNFSTLYAGIRR
jgi:hypothetical protein